MQTITADIRAILKARLQAGPSGFRGRVELGPEGSATSYRATRISTNKSLRLAADQAEIEFVNESGELGWGASFAAPTNTQVRAWQWYGDPANEVRTFTGLLDKHGEDREPDRAVISCRSRMKILIDGSFSATAPQGAGEIDAVRTPDNGVYVGWEVGAIVADLLDRAGWPAADRAVTTPGYVLDEFIVRDGASYAETIIGDGQLTGLVAYAAFDDELGVFHFEPALQVSASTAPRAVAYTFEAGVDLVSLHDETDQYDLRTRVKARGPLTTTTLTDTWIEHWRTEAISQPVGLWWDPADSANLRVVDRATKKLYTVRLADRVIIASAYIGGACPYPVGLSGDPSDASIYWLLSAPWRYGLGTSGNAVKKMRRSDNALLASYAIPDGDWTDLKVSASAVYLANYSADLVYQRSKADLSAIASFGHTFDAVAQQHPTGLMVDGSTISVFWWNAGASPQFLLCDEATLTTVDKAVKTPGTQLYGGEMNTTTHHDCWGSSDALGLVAEFTLVEAVDQTDQVYAEVVDTALEDELGALAGLEPRVHDTHAGDAAHPFEIRRDTVDLAAVTSIAQTTETAGRRLDLLARRRRVVDAGFLGNPALQKTDVVRIIDPVSGLADDFMVDTIRSDMDDVYLGRASLLPVVRSGNCTPDIVGHLNTGLVVAGDGVITIPWTPRAGDLLYAAIWSTKRIPGSTAYKGAIAGYMATGELAWYWGDVDPLPAFDVGGQAQFFSPQPGAIWEEGVTEIRLDLSELGEGETVDYVVDLVELTACQIPDVIWTYGMLRDNGTGTGLPRRGTGAAPSIPLSTAYIPGKYVWAAVLSSNAIEADGPIDVDNVNTQLLSCTDVPNGVMAVAIRVGLIEPATASPIGFATTLGGIPAHSAYRIGAWVVE